MGANLKKRPVLDEIVDAVGKQSAVGSVSNPSPEPLPRALWEVVEEIKEQLRRDSFMSHESIQKRWTLEGEKYDKLKKFILLNTAYAEREDGLAYEVETKDERKFVLQTKARAESEARKASVIVLNLVDEISLAIEKLGKMTKKQICKRWALNDDRYLEVARLIVQKPGFSGLPEIEKGLRHS